MSDGARPNLTCFRASQPAASAAASSANAAQKMRLAATLLSTGRARDALPLLDGVLADHPADPQAHHLRGRCLDAAGNAAGAYASYVSALTADPNHLPSLISLSALYKAKGLWTEALDAARKAQLARPNDKVVAEHLAVVLTDVGTHVKGGSDQGKAREAAAGFYRQAVAACPGYAPAHYNLGVVAGEAKEYDAALQHYQVALQLQPDYAPAHCNAGVIHRARGDLLSAIACYEAALAASPSTAVIAANLAGALTELATQIKCSAAADVAAGAASSAVGAASAPQPGGGGGDGDGDGGDDTNRPALTLPSSPSSPPLSALSEAIRLYERALALAPTASDTQYNLAVALSEARQFDRAIFMYEMVLRSDPQCAEAWNNVGVLYRERDTIEKAIECYSAAVQLRPNFHQALNNLAVVYTSQGRAQDALSLFQACLHACPTYAEAWNNIGVLQRDVGAVANAISSYEQCLKLMPAARNAGQNRLLALNYIHQGEEPAVCAAHLEWGDQLQAATTPLPPPLPPAAAAAAKARPLRVGYMSPDFYTHSVSYFAEAPLTHHSASAVVPYAYSCVVRADGKTAHLRQAVLAAGGVWRDVAALSEEALARQIRSDGIDVLVELTGHTAHNRLGTMAFQPAPVQVTWIGYPNSTGLRRVHYRFTDAVCDPEDTTQTYAEQLIRLPSCFLCYSPTVDAPPVSPLPALSNGFFTFGSFNNLAKMTPQVLKVWARILQRVPGSRLVVKNKPFACEGAKAHVMRLLAAEGVDAWRVDLLPLQPRNSDHLEKYALLDVSLDTFPYAGTTTTCESIYMGVPCITMTGRCHAHNVSASLLAAVGLDARDWVAADADGYVELAARHAAPEGLAALAALRQGLRVQMLASPLCDAPSFVSRLEGVYRELWCRYVDRATSGSAEGNYAANGGAPKAPAAVGAAAAHDGSCSAAAADALQGTHVHCSGASGGQTKTHRQQHGAGAAATSSTGRLCTSSPAALSAAPPSPPEEVVQVKLARIAVRDDCDANSDDSSSGCVAAVAATRRSRQPLTKKSRWSDAAALGGLESSVDASALGETAASAAPPPPLLSASPDASHLGGLPAAAAVEVGQDESVAGAGPVAGDGGRAAQPAGVTEARSDSDAAMTGNVDNGG